MIPILQVKQLFATYFTQEVAAHAVSEVNLSLFKGESIGIIGESGCGKSALVKSLIQLMPSTACIKGEILYQGKNLLNCSGPYLQMIRKKEIGIIFQDPMTAINPTMKVGNQILESYREAFPENSKQSAYNATTAILKKLGVRHVSSFLNAYSHELSGGLRQRVLIASALVKKPRILLADEPTTAIDATNRILILETLKEQQKDDDLSILLVSHDIKLISHFCDRVMIMYAGKIVESGNVKAVLSNPKHPYTQGLIKSTPSLSANRDRSLYSIEGFPPQLAKPLDHCGFCPRCPYAMNICALHSPPLFPIDKDHYCACFKNDPRYFL